MILAAKWRRKNVLLFVDSRAGTIRGEVLLTKAVVGSWQAGFAGHAFTRILPPPGHARRLGSRPGEWGRHGTLGIDRRHRFDLASHFGRASDRPRASRPDDAGGPKPRARGAGT